METHAPDRRITEGVILKQLLSCFFPILLGTFFQQLYNTVDTIIVGRFVGTNALAAVGATAALISLINGFFVGLSTGATVLVSQLFGANDRGRVSQALHTGICLSVILGGAVAAIGIGAGPWMLRLTNTPADCLEQAALYTRIYFAGAVASMVYNMGAGVLRAMGDSRRPTIFLMVTCLVNVAADVLLVVGLDMGVAGAALATVIAQAVSAVLVLLTLAKLPEDIRLRWGKLRLDRGLMGPILRVGLPAGLQFITFDLANLLVQAGVNSFGSVTVAAWTAYIKADSLTWMISGAFGVSITTFVGQNFGAMRYDRIRKSVKVCMGMSIALVGALSAVMLLVRTFVLGVYSADGAVVELGARLMLWTVPFNFLFMPVEVFAGAMRGTGYSVMPTLITCGCVCVFRVAWVLLVVSRIHMVELLAVCYPLSWVLASLVFFIAYLRGTWLHRRIRECGMEPERR